MYNVYGHALQMIKKEFGIIIKWIVIMEKMNTANFPFILKIKQTENNLNSMTRFRRFLRKTFLWVTVIEMGYQGR